jgi:anti-anti-sigma factor
MLKIIEIAEGRQTTLRLQGKVTGQWVTALEAVCSEALRAPATRVSVDLSDVSFIDPSGLVLMQQLMDRGVSLVNCSPFTAEQLAHACLKGA